MDTTALAEHATPLHSLDPDADDDSDLDVLREIVGDARVVLVGESAHFTTQFGRLQDRLTRFLVREQGFSAFVLESGLPEGMLVDRWVHGGPGRLPTVARHGITYAMGRCTEMHTQLRWLREHNATAAQPVSFAGMDVPGWCANPGPGVAACLARLDPRPGDQQLLAAAELGAAPGAPAVDAAGTPAAPPGLAARIGQLVDRAEACGDDLARQCARSALRLVEFLDGGLYPGPGRNLRNEVMAENLRMLLDHHQRIVVSAHTMHLQRSPSFDGTATIGMLLADELGEDLVVIGGTHTRGAIPDLDLDATAAERFPRTGTAAPPPQPHTLEAALDTTGHPLQLVDLRRTPPHALAGITATRAQTPQQSLLVHIEPQQAYDAVAHVGTITPAHGAAD
ncbi:erythromycin esterase family protein [Saccharopolyspora sp. HNM0983]|uniref:Erythromycin esterase family protein n=1 Tax=Saccharopolyspora montiporae TaxID=2781240 RepID=A0A929G1C7_9PSEU|nr:erythromycin esterase family protein [Saccharopolyspora sp. HNM0983]MBE9376179.1 erythromycin esterase family protein [Saccharopolyspora sp. HNM0983]